MFRVEYEDKYSFLCITSAMKTIIRVSNMKKIKVDHSLLMETQAELVILKVIQWAL